MSIQDDGPFGDNRQSDDGNAGEDRPLFAAIEPTDLVSHIERQITAAIVTGRMKPGERLTELQLSRQFGTSRAPVREAARLLENRGLVVSHPRRGFFVRSLTPEEMDEIYELRLGMELLAGDIAIDRMSEAHMRALEAQGARLHELADSGSIEDQIFADFRFHRLLCQGSGNRRLLKVYDELAAEMSMGIKLIGQLYDDPHRIAETHDPILDALKARDKPALRRELTHHLGIARKYVVELLRESQDQRA